MALYEQPRGLRTQTLTWICKQRCALKTQTRVRNQLTYLLKMSDMRKDEAVSMVMITKKF